MIIRRAGKKAGKLGNLNDSESQFGQLIVAVLLSLGRLRRHS